MSQMAYTYGFVLDSTDIVSENTTFISLKFLLISVSFFPLLASWQKLWMWSHPDMKPEFECQDLCITLVSSYDTAPTRVTFTVKCWVEVRTSETWQGILISVIFIEVHSLPPYAEMTNSTWRCFFYFLGVTHYKE